MENYQMTINDEQDLEELPPLAYYGNNDMMFYVFEGEAEFCTSDGKTTLIRKNDNFFIPKGSEGTWKILTPFAMLFIQTNSHDYPDSLSFRTLKTAEVLTRLKLKDLETLII
jgi:mannose-6-phosphate isomerase-like protein (cupin superfamily)